DTEAALVGCHRAARRAGLPMGDHDPSVHHRFAIRAADDAFECTTGDALRGGRRCEQQGGGTDHKAGSRVRAPGCEDQRERVQPGSKRTERLRARRSWCGAGRVAVCVPDTKCATGRRTAGVARASTVAWAPHAPAGMPRPRGWTERGDGPELEPGPAEARVGPGSGTSENGRGCRRMSQEAAGSERGPEEVVIGVSAAPGLLPALGRSVRSALRSPAAVRLRSWLRHGPDRLLHRLRRRRAWSRLSARPVTSVLVVCHGNICRSPYGEVA